MDWAIDRRGELVQAGTPGARNSALRCPACDARVYHKGGYYYRPHFAHYSGNFNRACELYAPGSNNLAQTHPAQFAADARGVGESPVLVWRDGQPASMSLWMRVPISLLMPRLSLCVKSQLGRQILTWSETQQRAFVRLPLRLPPATVISEPYDEDLLEPLNFTLRQFRLTGNFFRETTSGGVLENVDSPLELGESYIFVSQGELVGPYPAAFLLTDEVVLSQSWSIIRFTLRDSPLSRDIDTEELETFLGRAIAAPRPKVSVLWPQPVRFDMDGTPIHLDSVCQLIVSSGSLVPTCEDGDGKYVVGAELGGGIFKIDLSSLSGDVVLRASGARSQRLRFGRLSASSPNGVTLEASGWHVDLASSVDLELHQGRPVRVEVPNQRLWKSVRVDGERLSPCPDGRALLLETAPSSITAGAFGSFSVRCPDPISAGKGGAWGPELSAYIMATAGRMALAGLKNVETKQQAVQWANQYDCLADLPLVYSKSRLR